MSKVLMKKCGGGADSGAGSAAARGITGMAKKEELAAYVFLLPWIIGMLVFFAYPFLSSLYLAFTNARLTSGRFTGLENFIRMFTTDQNFLKSILVTSKYALLGVPLKLCFALMLALLLKKGGDFLPDGVLYSFADRELGRGGRHVAAAL